MPADYASSLRSRPDGYEAAAVRGALAQGAALDAQVREAAGEGGGLARMARRLGPALSTPSARARAGAAWRCFERASASVGEAPVGVVGVARVRGALLFRASVDRVQALGLGSYLSALRDAAMDAPGVSWRVSPTQYARLHRKFIPDIQRIYPSLVEAARQLGVREMRALERWVRPHLAARRPWYVQFWAWVTLGWGALLRGGDLFGRRRVDYHARNDQFSAAADGASLTYDRPHRKMRKRVRDRRADLLAVPECAADGGRFGALRALRAHLALAGRRVGADARPLFARLSRETGVELAPLLLQSAACRDLRFALRAAGVPDAAAFGLPSLRCGGATFLLSLGLPWPLVKRLGAWATDSAMMRYDRQRAALVRRIAAATAGTPADE